MISTQERTAPIKLDDGESTTNVFAGVADVVAEIGYCLKLSAQSLSFPRPDASSATRVDGWPIDLWAF
jgi:hypothetical protein